MRRPYQMLLFHSLSLSLIFSVATNRRWEKILSSKSQKWLGSGFHMHTHIYQASPQYSTIFSCAHILPLPYTFYIAPTNEYIFFCAWARARAFSVCALFHSFRFFLLLYTSIPCVCTHERHDVDDDDDDDATSSITLRSTICSCVCTLIILFCVQNFFSFDYFHLVTLPLLTLAAVVWRKTPFYRHSRRFPGFLAMPHYLVSFCAASSFIFKENFLSLGSYV